jgi:hypothetical protein
VGELLDDHEEPRGVFIYPDVTEPAAKDYAGILTEIGEAGFWVPRLPALPAALGGMDAGALGSALEGLMGALPPGMLAQVQSMLAGADLGALAQAAQQLQGTFAGREHELLAGLQGSLGAAREAAAPAAAEVPRAPLDPARLQAGVPSENQAPALWEFARNQVEAMRSRDPNGFAELERSVRAAAGIEGADQGPGEAPSATPIAGARPASKAPAKPGKGS